MNVETVREYCLAKPHATESFPFGEDTLVFKVGDKMFALMSLTWEDPGVNLKCDPEYALELRDQHDAVQPGYHMNKKHWNTVKLAQGLNDSLVKELIDHSYDLVLKSVPKKMKIELGLL